jgi:hypothetical protein
VITIVTLIYLPSTFMAVGSPGSSILAPLVIRMVR